MNRAIRRAALGGSLLTVCAAALLSAQGPVRPYKPLIAADHPAVAAIAPAGDAVARLAARLERGEVTLARGAGGPGESGQGALRAVLAALDVPVDSQLLVFSKTSVQAAHISPARPRAIYFRDDVMVAHVPGTPGLEAIAFDAARGPAFYALTAGAGGAPTFTASHTCLKCHHGPNTAGVPGVFVGSVVPGPGGAPLRDDTAIITDHRSPFAERWGGWFVTARRGEPPSRANAVAASPADRTALVRDVPRNLTALVGLVDASAYLAPTSDIVALMTLEHQTQMQNLLTRVAWQARVAEATRPGAPLANAGLAADLADLVDYMTFVDEVRLPGAVEGVSTFAATFAARGPTDAQGRSLREFDLRTRLFRYPVSYLIQSPAFDALPDTVRTDIYRRVYARLTDPSGDSRPGGPSPADRRAAVAIIRETTRAVPPFWRVPD